MNLLSRLNVGILPPDFGGKKSPPKKGMKKSLPLNATKKLDPTRLFKSVLGISVLGALTLLSGCAGLNSTFDCPMKPGVLCKSIDQVNTMVDRGQLGNTPGAPCKHCTATTTTYSAGAYQNFSTPYPAAAWQPGAPIRYSEKVMRIWVAPYQDKDGNYYQPTELYTVVKLGHWIGNPVTAVSVND